MKKNKSFCFKLDLSCIFFDILLEILMFCEKDVFDNFTTYDYEKLNLHKVEDIEHQKHFIDKNIFIKFDCTTLKSYIFDKFIDSDKFNDENVDYLEYLLKNNYDNTSSAKKNKRNGKLRTKKINT